MLSKQKKFLNRLKLSIKCAFQDFKQNLVHMNNWKRSGSNYWELSSELIFYYHKIEKGLSLPGEKRFFGIAVAEKVTKLLEEWKQSSLSQSDPIYLGAMASLKSYLSRFPTDITDDRQQVLFNKIKNIVNQDSDSFSTPCSYSPSKNSDLHTPFIELTERRRSVRNFKSKKIDIELVQKAALLAQQAPSACNRQPSRIHLFEFSEQQQELLSYQNGNRGFGDKIPLLAIITSESKAFFDLTERNEPYLDGGLFLSYFLLGLESLGLSSCCLNWSTTPWHDQQVRKIANISDSEKILTFLAIGYAEESIVVPRSAKRALDNILTLNNYK
jgi:nitroreductase